MEAWMMEMIKYLTKLMHICASEATYRIFGYHIHYRSISVLCLSFHLPGERICTFTESESLEKVVRREQYKHSQLETFFLLNESDVNARKYTYDQIPQYYVWNETDRKWCVQKKGKQIGRLLYTHHSSGELRYLRLLLSKVRGCTSFRSLQTVNGVHYSTFKDACKSLGLLDDDNEWHAVMKECAVSSFPAQIRQLFIHIIVNCQVTDMRKLWDDHWKHMIDDILLKRNESAIDPNNVYLDKQLQFFALAEIDKLLKSVGKSLKQFRQLPQPPSTYLQSGKNNLVIEETSYNLDEIDSNFKNFFQHCNTEQLQIFKDVVHSVQTNAGDIQPIQDPVVQYEEDNIEIPPNFCDPKIKNSVENMIQWTYPNFLSQYRSPNYLSERAILTPTNQVVGHLNSVIVDTIPGDLFTYYSIDRAGDFGGTTTKLSFAFPPEYLNSISIPGLPPHDPKLKEGVSVMLMHNLNQTLGLCNGTRMMITRCLKQCVECQVINGVFIGTKHFIPRMELSSTDTKLPFKLIRKQMPLQV
ncbi:uncharacterized protein LOC141673193 [Apium graveolens]|uniref:uncharacterized protein LOC141673193 n=1 Tax=Apium graveolens TaxID=4045 RepID=UPI003D79A1CC